jgi:DNA-binding PadR family transcriptional regulator
VSQSVLELFILSLIDRGLQTAYDLQHQAGISLGSSTPALQRLATAGLIKRDVVTSTSRRPRHCYRITAAGRKLARTGWIDRLKDPAPNDLEAVLRLLDMATHYRADVDDIAGFLKSSARDRTSGLSAKPSRSKPGDTSGAYLSTLRAWTSTRLQTESRFLAALADSWLQTKRPSGKVRSS